MKFEQIAQVIDKIDSGPSKWELDNIIYWDRLNNSRTLHSFLARIQKLEMLSNKSREEALELDKLKELLDDIDLEDCESLINQDEDEVKESFIENLARSSAIQILTLGRIETQTMETACKLSPNDFILCAKRTQDLINSIQGLVIKGESLSKDVAGA